MGKIEVEIPTYCQRFFGGKAKNVYQINITTASNNWSVERRYNDFCCMNTVISKTHGNIPKLPKKFLFALKPEQLEQRRLGLENYLKAICERIDVHSDTEFTAFMRIEENSPHLIANKLVIQDEISHPKYGYRGF